MKRFIIGFIVALAALLLTSPERHQTPKVSSENAQIKTFLKDKSAPSEGSQKEKTDETRVITFANLGGFEFPIPEPNSKVDLSVIPQNVQDLNQQSVQIQGYVMLLDASEESIQKILLMKDSADCCFGGTPQMTDWVLIEMPKDKALKTKDSMQISVQGKIEVLPVSTDDGWLLSIYRIRPKAAFDLEGTNILEDLN